MELQKYFTELDSEFVNRFDISSIKFNQYCTGRTKFQLKYFVENEHDTPQRKFLQLLNELRALRDGYVIDVLEMENIQIKIDELIATGKPADKIEALKEYYKLSGMKEQRKFRNIEIQYIVDLINELPKIYTPEEIEESEQVYWEKRLTRQSMEDMVNRVTGINQGNIRAAISTNGSLGKKLNEISYSMMSGLKDSTNLIAGQ